MNSGLKKMAGGLGVVCLLGLAITAHGFALLGPYESWMQETNGLRQPQYGDFGLTIQPEDIGGPMDLGSGYRWNVPVITYGFDRSFLDYFGANGVAAVKSAIQIFNELPPASSMVLTNFPVTVRRVNYVAQAFSNFEPFYDLKSQTMSVMLEELGLSQPSRYTFVLKQWDSSLLSPDSSELSGQFWGWAISSLIVQRNFDPETLAASSYVNEALYSGLLLVVNDTNHFMVTFPIDSEVGSTYFSVAEFNQEPGEFYTGLSRDDVGGLRYLLSTKTINYETLLPDVRTANRTLGVPVDGAWRPGVDKITLVEQPTNPRTGSFLSYSYRYTDHYITPEVFEVNSVRRTRAVLMRQQLERVVTKPDILFSVSDTGSDAIPPQVNCTDTSHWINNAARNGNSTGAGPGVIRPGITITFGKGTGEATTLPDGQWVWASFDASTNVPIVYPATP